MSADRTLAIEWLTARIAEALGIDPATIDAGTEFFALGLSSLLAVKLSDDLQRWADLSVSPTLLYDFPTIEGVASYLAGEAGRRGRPLPGLLDAAAGQEPPDTAAAADMPDGAIAIVGIGCRLPGAAGPEGFWRLVRDGVDAVGDVPADRWDPAAYYDPDAGAPGRMNTRWGGFLDDVEGFDASFFGISAREAARMDPQQRIVLEVSWEALEDAGIAAGGLAGSSTGVYFGASTFDHATALFSVMDDAEPHDGTGGALSIVANRLSYCLNLRGPSMTVDTACSSSLVAVHLACQALRNGESDLALAGGVNVITSPRIALSFSRGGLMAADGRCKPFDRRADGYVRSEGAGVVVLKPLPRALADGDRIYAVLLGGAVNQDGRTNGLTAPNRPAQEAVLRASYKNSGVSPARVDYVEAHGTGTAVGDPIEVGALAAVLGEHRGHERPLWLGSVKSNLGHLEAAAGVTGLIKTALMLHHGLVPPTVHFERANPLLGLDRIPLAVSDRLMRWPDHGGAPHAGVSSFGFGGTNAHVVLTAAPSGRPGSNPGAEHGDLSPHLVTVSARTPEALARRAFAWADVARDHAGDPDWLGRIAAAAALRTDHHPYRAAVVAADSAQLADGMAAIATGDRRPEVAGPRSAPRRDGGVVLVFPGQGSQWDGMGRRLAACSASFRDAIRRCDAAISRVLGRSLWSDENGLIAEGTATVQPAIFAIQVALAETWRSWGLRLSAVVGHSMGEIAAAHISGAISLEDAARIACERSRLLAEISGSGGLALVELTMDETTEELRGHERLMSIAAANGPRATVVSGDPAALDDLVARLSARGVFARRVAVEFAAHSPQVDPLRSRLRAAVAGIRPKPCDTPLFSTVTGEPIAGTDLDFAYWERNLREPVLFAPAMERLIAAGHDLFVEVAPHPVLSQSIAEMIELSGRDAVVVPSLHRDEDEPVAMIRSLGELYAAGLPLDWSARYPKGAHHSALPPHGWDRRRFPVSRPGVQNPAQARTLGDGSGSGGPLVGKPIRVGVAPGLDLRLVTLDLESAPEISDHVVDDVPVVPGAYWFTAAVQAADASESVVLEDVRFSHWRPLRPGEDHGLQINVRREDAERSSFVITSAPESGPTVVHAEGVLRAGTPEDEPPAALLSELVGIRAPAAPADPLYERLEAAGLRYGPRFRGLLEVQGGQDSALGKIRQPSGLPLGAAPLHPALLDACLHTIAAAAGEYPLTGLLPLPAGAERVWARVDTQPVQEGWAYARLTATSSQELIADVTVLDGNGGPVWAATGLRVRLVPRRPVERGRLYEPAWQATAVPEAGQAGGHWLILPDSGGGAEALMDRLTRAGERCLLAGPAEGGLAEGGPAGIAAMLADATRRAGGPLRGIVDARALSCTTGHDVRSLQASAAGALHLAQAMAASPWETGPPRLWLLCSGTQAVSPAATVTPAGAAVWGLGRTLANELSRSGCSLLDLSPQPSDQDLEAAVALLRSATPPSQAAVRKGRLFGLALRTVSDLGARAPRLDPERLRVVTGGLGGIGLLMARWLVERGARNLLLLGRAAPSPEAEAAIARLRELGASIRVEQADLADAVRLRAVLECPDRTGTGIGGVYHLAGVLEDATFVDLGEAPLGRALSGKAAGAWNLHELTRSEPLDEFVMFSSLAGLLGSPGQGAYAAANTVLDALAHHRAALGLPALSVNWGPWSGVGLAVQAGGLGRLAARGIPPLSPDSAFGLIDEALGGQLVQVAAAAFGPGELVRAAVGPAFREPLADLLPSQDTAGAMAPGQARERIAGLDSVVARGQAMSEFLSGQLAQVLNMPVGQIGENVPFQDLGFDSLMAIELRNRLESALGLRLSAAVVYSYPTARELAAALLGRIEAPDKEPMPDGTDASAPPAAARTSSDLTDELGDLAHLTDEEALSLLEAELEAHRDLGEIHVQQDRQ